MTIERRLPDDPWEQAAAAQHLADERSVSRDMKNALSRLDASFDRIDACYDRIDRLLGELIAAVEREAGQ